MRIGLKTVVTMAAASLLFVAGGSIAAADASSERLAGTNRYLTAVEVSKQLFPEGVSTAFVASGENYPDAVVAGAAGGAYDYPVLLTGRTVVPEPVLDELKRLNPVHIVVLGGTGAVSRVGEDELAEIGAISRLSGENRYATAVMVAQWAFDPGVPVVYLASGANFADALSGGVAGALAEGPVLLTTPRSLSKETSDHLAEFKPRRIVLLGGTNAISERVAEQAAEFAPVTRLAGPDRYGTSAAVSEATFRTASTVLLADGRTYPDALSGTPLAARLRAPVLLVDEDSVPTEICAEIRRLGPTRVIALGGAAAVTDATLSQGTACAAPLVVQPTPQPTATIGPPTTPTGSGG